MTSYAILRPHDYLFCPSWPECRFSYLIYKYNYLDNQTLTLFCFALMLEGICFDI